ncbi:MAG: succinate dehydrogenase assembly factor 2 [Magnetococcales bacterium]|nr:succinate dehydrogenase assembly factor 2 [Magnetococcales bacterium]
MGATYPAGPMTPLQKQLFFQAARRSMAEIERILSRFIEAELADLNDEQCQRFLCFLDHADPDILDWVTGVSSPPTTVDAEVLSWMVRFRSEQAS